MCFTRRLAGADAKRYAAVAVLAFVWRGWPAHSRNLGACLPLTSWEAVHCTHTSVCSGFLLVLWASTAIL